MTQQEPTDRSNDCYFRLVITKGIGKKRQNLIPQYSLPTLHSDELSMTVFKRFFPSKDVDSDQEKKTVDKSHEMLSESEDQYCKNLEFLTS